MSERDCGHGQIVQNDCPCCEEKIGHELSDDYSEPRYCMCADPENCTEAVPGRICKAGKTTALQRDSES